MDQFGPIRRYSPKNNKCIAIQDYCEHLLARRTYDSKVITASDIVTRLCNVCRELDDKFSVKGKLKVSCTPIDGHGDYKLSIDLVTSDGTGWPILMIKSTRIAGSYDCEDVFYEISKQLRRDTITKWGLSTL